MVLYRVCTRRNRTWDSTV